jgi:ubiquinone/menaquinone biosynthesis C-methylase UbiE
VNFEFLSYGLDDLKQNTQIRLPEFQIAASAKKTAYPIRAIRYWWVCQVLSRQLIAKPDATIVDVGAGHGQMRRYCAGSMPSLSPKYPFGSQHWIGLDRNRLEEFSTAGYEQIVECDFDKPLPIESGSVDALICIHVMEHLPRPEFTMSEIARVLAPGGIFCGGSPTAPEPVSSLLHRWLRSKMRKGTTGPNGHINSFSPNAWKRMVKQAGLELEFMSGSHLMRLSGNALENSKVWARLNLFWGGLFPSLGSEVYFLARKSAEL